MLGFRTSLKSFKEPESADEGFGDFRNRDGIVLMENIVE